MVICLKNTETEIVEVLGWHFRALVTSFYKCSRLHEYETASNLRLGQSLYSKLTLEAAIQRICRPF